MTDPEFEKLSQFEAPNLEYVFEIDLDFKRMHHLPNTPSGYTRSAVYVDSGKVSGPKLNGIVVPNSGGDWAEIRADKSFSFDARYMIETDDGECILIRNRGFLWGRKEDTVDRIREWIFNGGEPVPESEYYLRASPSFETSSGKYDWLTRHVIVGVGKRKEHGNTVRYYALL